MTLALACSTPSCSFITLSSSVVINKASPVVLEAPPSISEVKLRQRKYKESRFSLRVAANSLLDWNIKAKRAERRRVANEEFEASVEAFLEADTILEKRCRVRSPSPNPSSSSSTQQIMESWRAIGVDVEKGSPLMPKCTPEELSNAVSSFFGHPTIITRSKAKKQRLQKKMIQ